MNRSDHQKQTRKDKPLCDCGEPATRRFNSAWQCERCISISPDDYHHHNTVVGFKVRPGMSGNKLLMEWQEANA